MADKKIAIMTWLYNGNYGTLLQAYALHTFVKNEGYEVENINYRSSLKTKLKNWFVNRNSPALFVGKFKEKFSKKDSVANEKRNENFSDFLNSINGLIIKNQIKATAMTTINDIVIFFLFFSLIIFSYRIL